MGRIVSPNSQPIFPCWESTSASSSSSSSLSWSSPTPKMTTSTSITKTVNGSHMFNISGYSLVKGMGTGKYVESDYFTAGGYSWAIYFYPDGKNVNNDTYVSLFIVLVSEDTSVRALFELMLWDQSGKERHKVHTQFGRTPASRPYTIKNRGSKW